MPASLSRCMAEIAVVVSVRSELSVISRMTELPGRE